MATVYLLHFSRKFKHARHYIGMTGDLAARMARHRAGDGARLLRALNKAGISYRVTRKWRGGGDLEKRLKTIPKDKLCPTCSGPRAHLRGKS